MSDSFWKPIFKAIFKFFGRRKFPQEISFDEKNVVSSSSHYLRINSMGLAYISLDNNAYAVATSSDGNVHIIVKGGVTEIPSGRYRLQYVDKRSRTKTLPKVEAISLDGVTVSLVITVSFRVVNPARVLELHNPIDSFMSMIQANARGYIRSRSSSEIYQDVETRNVVGFLLKKHAEFHIMSKAFSILEMVVEYWKESKNKVPVVLDGNLKNVKPILEKINGKSGNLKVFLCHAAQDKPVVRELYNLMSVDDWLEPWFDERNLLPGQDWNVEIEKAVELSDAIIVCLSSTSVSKSGYIQKELRQALDIALEKPEGEIFIIPIRLDDCEVPRRLRNWQYVDYFPGENRELAYHKILDSLRLRMQ